MLKPTTQTLIEILSDYVQELTRPDSMAEFKIRDFAEAFESWSTGYTEVIVREEIEDARLDASEAIEALEQRLIGLENRIADLEANKADK